MKLTNSRSVGFFGKNLIKYQEKYYNFQDLMWSKIKNMGKLVLNVGDRISRNQNDFDVNNLKLLSEFHSNIRNYLYDTKKFKELKEQTFFKTYIHAIKFIPSFYHFGLGQYYLCIRPNNIEEFDFRLLLANNF